MKKLVFSFWLIFIFSTSAVFAQSEAADWSALFPEFPGCERVIKPLAKNGEIFEQTAVYEREGFRESKNQNYVGCGSITLRLAPSARKSASVDHANSLEIPPVGKRKIKTFDAYDYSPLCGNDDWLGTTSVYFDEDKSLTASAYTGAFNILQFAENADYELLKKSIDNFIKDRKNKN